jgi:hypothetical protein
MGSIQLNAPPSNKLEKCHTVLPNAAKLRPIKSHVVTLSTVKSEQGRLIELEARREY